MGTIFSLSGSKAVGKTTLVNGLRKTIPCLRIREGFRQTATGFDMDIEEEYYKNQQWYIKREIDEYYQFKSGKEPVLLLRGPEDVEFYTLHYPLTKKYQWDVEKNLKPELERIRQCRSDYIIYLDASLDVIKNRKIKDTTKPRKNMDNWLNNWQPYIELYMKRIAYAHIVNTDNLLAIEVLEEITQWIQERI